MPVLAGLPQIRRFDASFNRWQGTTSDAVYEALRQREASLVTAD